MHKSLLVFTILDIALALLVNCAGAIASVMGLGILAGFIFAMIAMPYWIFILLKTISAIILIFKKRFIKSSLVSLTTPFFNSLLITSFLIWFFPNTPSPNTMIYSASTLFLVLVMGIFTYFYNQELKTYKSQELKSQNA